MKMIDTLTGRTRFTVNETRRVLTLRNGRIEDILGPGEQVIWAKGLMRETFSLSNPVFTSDYLNAMEQTRPDLMDAHFTIVEGADNAVTVIFRRDVVVEVLRNPWDRRVLWTDAGPWRVERFALDEMLAVSEVMRPHVLTGALSLCVYKATVEPGYVGLMYLDGELMARLKPGVHLYWNVGRQIEVKCVDLRVREYEVTGQEILTADRVSLRANITAEYRVADPEKAVGVVKDFTAALHRSMQLAYRKALGAKTLDGILAEKGLVDEEAAAQVKAEMALMGVTVTSVSLKDVILPGEMRDILNRVVEASKEAEAGAIRRREQADETRTMLNAAKAMADNPVMMRLKELEALTEIAANVDRLTVVSGADGLTSDLVRMAD